MKKIRDLTEEELNAVCKKYNDCIREAGKVNCPLWCGECLKGFIHKLQQVEKKIEL